MAVEVLKKGKDIATMPIAYDENPVKVQQEICDELGIVILQLRRNRVRCVTC